MGAGKLSCVKLEEGPEIKKSELNGLKRATERNRGRDTGKIRLQNRTELISLSVHLHE